MNEEQENNNQDSFIKEKARQGKELAKEEAKKQAKQKIVQFLAANPEVLAGILIAIAVIIIGVILVAGFVYVLDKGNEKKINAAKESAVAISYDGQTGVTENSSIIIKPSNDGKAYEISNTYTDEDINGIKNEILSKTAKDLSQFSDFEIAILGALMHNGLDLDSFTIDELKCLPSFIKAESCTQFLDLRKNSQKFKSGEYVPQQLSDLKDNEVPGVILVQRTNTNSESPITLEYIEKSKFEELVDKKDEDVIKYFTVNEKGNLVIAKWDYIKITVDGDYPENLNEEEKVQERDEYIITDPRTDSTTEIPYSQYVSKYTMPFDFLTQLLIITKDIEFCKEVADTVLGSKIIINIQEEEKYTKTTEVQTFTTHNKEVKNVSYIVEPNLESSNEYFLDKMPDDEGNRCTTYETDTKTVTVTTEDISHTYALEITEADTWIAHYIKAYEKKDPQGPVITKDPLPESKGKYEEGENIVITDTNQILDDKDVKEFKKQKEQEYKGKVTIPTVKVSTHTKGVFSDRTYKEITVSPKDKFDISLSTYEFDGKEVQSENGEITYTYDMPQSFTVTTKATKDFPARIKFIYTLNKQNYQYSLTNTNQDDILKCNISSLTIKPFSKVDINLKDEHIDNYIKTEVTKYPSDPNPLTTVDIYYKDDNGNFEKFLKAYDNNKKARDMIKSVDSWLFEMMEENENTEKLVDLVKFLLYRYDGTNYGVTELDLSLFEPDEFITATGGGSALWNNDITKDEFINIVKNYSVPSGSGKYGTYKWGYERYFIPNAENFYDIATSYGLDPRFIFCIGIHESGFGTSAIANEKGNFFGWNANDSNPYGDASSFYDMSSGIETVCKGLANQYVSPNGSWYQWIIDKGYSPTTIQGIGCRYASDPNWANAVIKHMKNIFNYEPGFAANGNFLAVAKECHDYIRQQNYSYINGTTIPADENNVNGIDCSAYVTWVLYEYGYTELKGHQKTCSWFMNTSTMQKMGWTVLPATQAEAGDIVVNSHHMEIYAGDGKFYNAGSTEAIRREISNCGVGYLNDFTYAIRVTPPGGI